MSIVQRVQETLAARAEVEPVVGTTLAMDSANAVYVEALNRIGRDGDAFAQGGAERAWRIARGGGRTVTLATDEQRSARAAMFPDANRVRG